MSILAKSPSTPPPPHHLTFPHHLPFTAPILLTDPLHLLSSSPLPPSPHCSHSPHPPWSHSPSSTPYLQCCSSYPSSLLRPTPPSPSFYPCSLFLFPPSLHPSLLPLLSLCLFFPLIFWDQRCFIIYFWSMTQGTLPNSRFSYENMHTTVCQWDLLLLLLCQMSCCCCLVGPVVAVAQWAVLLAMLLLLRIGPCRCCCSVGRVVAVAQWALLLLLFSGPCFVAVAQWALLLLLLSKMSCWCCSVFHVLAVA